MTIVVPGKEVGEFHYIKATNPLNIVAATDKFMASDCGKIGKHRPVQILF